MYTSKLQKHVIEIVASQSVKFFSFTLQSFLLFFLWFAALARSNQFFNKKTKPNQPTATSILWKTVRTCTIDIRIFGRKKATDLLYCSTYKPKEQLILISGQSALFISYLPVEYSFLQVRQADWQIREDKRQAISWFSELKYCQRKHVCIYACIHA